MKAIDPGHDYVLAKYDKPNMYDDTITPHLTFMKRQGDGYPGNEGQHAGTNCQEVLRVLVDRVKYLDKQFPCWENDIILQQLREALLHFELRAARRHGFNNGLVFAAIADRKIEDAPTCATCGHIICRGHKK